MQRWDAEEHGKDPTATEDPTQHLAYLRHVVPVLTGFTGLGLPEPESGEHGARHSRPSTAKGEHQCCVHCVCA